MTLGGSTPQRGNSIGGKAPRDGAGVSSSSAARSWSWSAGDGGGGVPGALSLSLGGPDASALVSALEAPTSAASRRQARGVVGSVELCASVMCKGKVEVSESQCNHAGPPVLAGKWRLRQRHCSRTLKVGCSDVVNVRTPPGLVGTEDHVAGIVQSARARLLSLSVPGAVADSSAIPSSTDFTLAPGPATRPAA